MNEEERTKWIEFSDRDIVDWKRIRIAIEHENTLTNQRVTWLLSSQGFFLAAYVFIFNVVATRPIDAPGLLAAKVALMALVIGGVFFSFFLSLGIRAAFDQHNKLSKWWRDKNPDKNLHPEICGAEPKFICTIQYYHFPWFFVLVWIILAGAPYVDLFSNNYQDILKKLSEKLPYIVAIIISLIIGFWFGRMRKKK